jgi:hypothetical protein
MQNWTQKQKKSLTPNNLTTPILWY